MSAKKKASGRNIPEASRGTERLMIRVPHDVKDEFEELARRWGLTHGGTLARLLEERQRT